MGEKNIFPLDNKVPICLLKPKEKVKNVVLTNLEIFCSFKGHSAIMLTEGTWPPLQHSILPDYKLSLYFLSPSFCSNLKMMEGTNKFKSI